MSQIQEYLARRNQALKAKKDVLSGACVYLSGPMDFVASRADEKSNGWRNRVGQFLREYGVKIYDPWNKPKVVGMPHYGKEDEFSNEKRDRWTFEESGHGDLVRAQLCAEFWPTLHIDLRMVDYADFIIAYTPTNVYSVGTVHEIVLARQEFKPVLLVSPSIKFPALDELEEHLTRHGDRRAQELLEKVKAEVPIKPNERGLPSSWYMALIDGQYFFDGFGFSKYRQRFGWKLNALDRREEEVPPKRPLLPYLEKLNHEIPKRFDLEQGRYVENSDWMIFDDEAAIPVESNLEMSAPRR